MKASKIDRASLFRETREVIYKNMIKYHHKENPDFHYTKPSPGRYPYQFFWDTCFHVFILCALEEHQMAKEHLYSLFALQEKNGFVGHMIYWDRLVPGRMTDIFQSRPKFKYLYRPHMSALVQPPMAALAVLEIYNATGDRDFLKVMVPKLKRYYHWLATHRDFDGDGLLTIISPFESGMDWKPTYDIVLNFRPHPANWKLFLKVVKVDFWNFILNYDLHKIYKKGHFLVKEVGFNTIYVQNLEVMSQLCRLSGDSAAEYFDRLAIKAANSILALMYNKTDKAFYDLYGKENVQIKILTPTIFFPLALDIVDNTICQQVITAHFSNKGQFNVPYPLPSLAVQEAAFQPKESRYIWRGPTWVINNWFLNRVFLKRGYRSEAHKLVESVRELIKKSGFREYYHPFTGAGMGAENFTWAGLVTDMIRQEAHIPKENSTL